VAAEPEPEPAPVAAEPEPEPVAADPNSVVIDLTERTEDHQVQRMQEVVADDSVPAFNGTT
ncbi:MAG: cell division protein FtsZ, partial [Actinobacteria bacterium]|nr:cell division protein FtsZ [Actinomycetota bacterium]